MLLANRLRKVIGSIVSYAQFTFIKWRQTCDEILIASEVVDEARKFKVDFKKTYNYVDLKYLDVVMGKINFLTLWGNWIMECVDTIATSVLVNGGPIDEFTFYRGLWQGRRISHFLFLIVTKGLNVMRKATIKVR